MSQVNSIIICGYENCPYNHEQECSKDILFVDDPACIAQAEKKDKNE